MKRYITIITIILVATAPFVASASSSCVRNLREIDGAKDQYALEYGGELNTSLTVDQVGIYMKDVTKCFCPLLTGTNRTFQNSYVIGVLTQSPVCIASVPDDWHSLDTTEWRRMIDAKKRKQTILSVIAIVFCYAASFAVWARACKARKGKLRPLVIWPVIVGYVLSVAICSMVWGTYRGGNDPSPPGWLTPFTWVTDIFIAR